jgi:hypothetical protein
MRCLLPWIPLMKGGRKAGIIQRWIELAALETDARLRADFGGLALVFAEAAGHLDVWKEALKEWDVRESKQVREWMEMGEAQGQIHERMDSLLQLLQKRFPPTIPPEIESAIRSMEDLQQLRRCFDAALDARSLDEFRHVLGNGA